MSWEKRESEYYKHFDPYADSVEEPNFSTEVKIVGHEDQVKAFEEKLQELAHEYNVELWL